MKAAPQLIAFADLLPDAFLGSHAGMVQAALPAPGFALWLMPVLAGPIFFGGQWLLWYALGGYLGTAPVLLALLGLGARGGARRDAGAETGARRLLAGWIVCIAGLAAGLAPFVALARLVPPLGRVLVSRYANGSLSLALVLLACFALQDWTLRRTARRAGMRAALACLLLLALCMRLAWPVLAAVSGVPGAMAARLASLGLALATTLLLAWLLGGPPGRRRLHGVVAAASVETLLLFCVPLLSATPHPARFDTATVDALRERLGVQRVTSLGGVMNPNYGAYWGIASINHNAIPLPLRWTKQVHDAIDPATDPVQFYGADGPDAAGTARRAAALLAHLSALRALGVAALVTPPGAGLPGDAQVPAAGRLDAGYATLVAGESLSAAYPPAGPAPAAIGSLQLVVGTFRGAASGTLQARLCDRTACAQGTAELGGAADNAPLSIRLDRPLTAGSGLVLRLSHPDGAAVAVALWRIPGGLLPRLWLGAQDAPVLVRRGAAADLYALPNPAPYAEATPGCALRLRSRTDMVADCPAGGTLLRRELFMPGWRVRLDGPARLGWRPVRPDGAGMQAGLFQGVTLPAGRWRVRFAYAPPHAWLGWCGLALAGAMAVTRIAGFLAGRRAIRARTAFDLDRSRPAL